LGYDIGKTRKRRLDTGATEDRHWKKEEEEGENNESR
jgi:hypothetical protein